MAENQTLLACVPKWIPTRSPTVEVATDLRQRAAQKATGAVDRKVRRTIESIRQRCSVALANPIERRIAQRFVFRLISTS